MTLTILDTTMTSDQNPHTIRHAPERNGWEVSVELGLTATDATARVSESPEKTSNQEPATSGADPEAEL